MAPKALRFCLQAFIIQSLTCVIIDGAPCAPGTPWAIASSIIIPAPATTPALPCGPIAAANAAAKTSVITAAPSAPVPAAATNAFKNSATFAPMAASAKSAPSSSNAQKLAASYGGGLSITSASPLAPTGVSFRSENKINGGVKVAGEVPFLAAVSLEGEVPTRGSGNVAYKCGTGEIAMTSEDFDNLRASPMTAARGYGARASPMSNGCRFW